MKGDAIKKKSEILNSISVDPGTNEDFDFAPMSQAAGDLFFNQVVSGGSATGMVTHTTRLSLAFRDREKGGY